MMTAQLACCFYIENKWKSRALKYYTISRIFSVVKTMWCRFMLSLNLLAAVHSINRPVYKIVLTQKGFAQFLQYDVETPPLREFTFCAWIRMYDLARDQSIFTYVVNGNNRVIRLWLSSGGKEMKISINKRVISSSRVDILKDVWRHVCLSYQSDYGAWALYIDARLIYCEATQNLYGYVLPPGGSVIVGYGTADNGESNGFEGEIFGANMILTSTIERNYTNKNDPGHEQKPFTRNKIKNNNKNNYIVLRDLQTDEIHNNFDKTPLPGFTNNSKSFIKFRTPHSFVEHNVGSGLNPNTPKMERQKIFDFTITDKTPTAIYNKDEMNIWNIVNLARQEAFRTSQKTTTQAGISESRTRDIVRPPIISEYETPPPPSPANQKFYAQNFEMEKKPKPLSIYKINSDSIVAKKTFNNKKYINEISEFETPPPPDKNTKVYGQWTSSKFAGSVLNYLKSINFHNKEQKKVPQTIPLIKVSDTFPYASDFKVNKVRSPLQFQRRNLVESLFDFNKKSPQINVQILKDDLRANIIKSHAQTRPEEVEIINRGESKKKDHRHYRNVDNQNSVQNVLNSIEKENFKPRPFAVQTFKKNHKYSSERTLQNNNLISILPFLKSLEYFLEDSINTETKMLENSDPYAKSLSNANKWHNSKSYSNDYTPRQIHMESNGEGELDKKIAEYNKKHPSVRLNYKHETNKVEKTPDTDILKGRKLATEVSNQSNDNKNSISLLKFNHGFLPAHENKVKISDKLNTALSGNLKARLHEKNNFNQHVKIGNALNERDVIGDNDDQKKQSFVGGYDGVPDINRYRSDIDNINNNNIPPSLGPRVCKNVELYDRVLYVQPDESIDMTHILSPVRVKNIGIEFIMQNYKKCSLSDSSIEKNKMLFIDWSKTPVRLFGGAFPRTTTDLCGFF